jgi:hypothetical protein
MAEVAIKLAAGTVVDRQLLNKVKSEDLAGVLAGIYADPNAQVIVVDNVAQFFSTKNLLVALDQNAAELPLILEHRGITLNADDIDVVRQFSEVKQHVMDQIAALTPPPPPYPFAEVPEDWNIDTQLKFNTASIRRMGNTSYSISNKTLREVWEAAAGHWTGGDKVCHGTLYVRASGYGNWLKVYDERIEIGCQKIQRFELEQVALRMGWDMPAAKAVGE